MNCFVNMVVNRKQRDLNTLIGESVLEVAPTQEMSLYDYPPIV